MKNILFFCIFVSVFLCCGCSKMSKAEALAKQEVLKYLYVPESYDPVETKLDSVFSPGESVETLSLVDQLLKLENEINRLDSQIREVKDRLSFFPDSHDSFWEKQIDNLNLELSEKMDEYNALITDYDNLYNKINNLLNAEQIFCGYKIYQRFRCKNNNGEITFSDVVIYTDEDIQEVKAVSDCDKLNPLLNAINNIKNR